MPLGGSLELLRTWDHSRWMEVLERVQGYDFHHLPSYHRLAEIEGEGDAYLAVLRQGDHVLALPMLIRRIEIGRCASQPEALYDATSVHGYVGPLASTPHLPSDIKQRFAGKLSEFYGSLRVVSAFNRLHPLLPQSHLLEGYGEMAELGVTTSVDLTVTRDARLARYRKSHRYEIQRLRKAGFVCEEVGPDYLDQFIEIYHEAMRELGADPYYLFGRSHFDHLMSKMSDVMHLFVCRDGETVACAALFAVCGNIVQYHLAGTAAEYRRLAPMKLLLDAACDWGSEIGAKILHLGGGVGAKRDSLFEFKKGFGGCEHPYLTWRCVVQPELYDDLCCSVYGRPGAQVDSRFFPAYRDPAISDKDTVSIA